MHNFIWHTVMIFLLYFNGVFNKEDLIDKINIET